MRTDTAVDYLVKKVDEDIESISSNLSFGRATSYEDYKYKTGMIRGIRMVRDHIQSLVKEMENNDE